MLTSMKRYLLIVLGSANLGILTLLIYMLAADKFHPIPAWFTAVSALNTLHFVIAAWTADGGQ